MRDRFLVLLASLAAFCLFVIAFFDLLGRGTCGALADQLWSNCWGVLLFRSLTGWPTNVAAAVVDCLLAALALASALAIARRGFDEPVETPPNPKGYAGFLIPLAIGAGVGVYVRLDGATYWDSIGFGLFIFALAGWGLWRDL
ncbi:MAG: hypothetical protein IPL03_12995 [Sterolibacteriaceae bacterium]|nr:hypothetical protein [Candidatus Methylophosphatis haderslevensis]